MPIPVLTFRYKHLGQPYSFAVQAPYTEGHLLTKGEAQALNNLRMENIRENLRPAFTSAAAAVAEAILPEAAIAAIQRTIDDYDAKFQFRERHEAKPRMGALERLAAEIAAARAPDGASEAELALLATSIDIVSEARQRLEAQQRVSSSALEDLL